MREALGKFNYPLMMDVKIWALVKFAGSEFGNTFH